MPLFKVILPMINQVYQLVAPRQFDVTYNNVDIYGNHVIVRPLYLSICAADKRYESSNGAEYTYRKTRRDCRELPAL